MENLAVHYILEYYGCNPEKIKTTAQFSDILNTIVNTMELTKVAESYKQFEPYGASGIILISESHISGHSWPEKGYLALDIFTCNLKCKPDKAVRQVKKLIGSTFASMNKLDRGLYLIDEKTEEVKQEKVKINEISDSGVTRTE